MYFQNIKIMKSICPECKNGIDLSRYPAINAGMIIECNHCGITLLANKIEGDNLMTEIVDEGK